MRLSRRPALVLSMAFAVALTGLAAEGIPRAAANAPAADSATERVLVRLDGGPALAGVDRARIDTRGEVSAAAVRAVRERRAELRTAQDRFLTAVRDAGIDATARARLTGLVNGVALTVPAADRSRLADLPGVSSVVEDTVMHASTDRSVDLIGASQVWKREDPEGDRVRGAGTTIAVIDTGVDYSHPDLGGDFGPDQKVVGGHDFVNNDDDPMDDNGHGTHVAGIVAADGQRPDGVVGVAPEARITAYKVLGADGSGYTSDIIAGLEAAVDPGNPHRADVVNMSLGGPGDGTDPLGQAATAATELGVVVVAAAGNSGPGASTVSTPAVADGVLSVGASTSGLTLPTAHMVTPRRELLQTYRAPYSANPPQRPVTGELVDVGSGTEEDYERVGDVTGKVVAYRARLPQSLKDVAPRLLEQAREAEERGAIALLGYTGSSGPVLDPQATPPGAGDVGADGTVRVELGTRQSGDSFRMDDIVVLGLAETQWPELSAALAEGPVEISVSGRDVTDQIASFSSRGPGPGFSLEPDLVAPGVEIRSTWPKRQWEPGTYRLSGTSMAAPHVAASAALLRQLDPDASGQDIRDRLIGSATPVEDAPTTAQGTGRLDVDAAADATLTASPTALSLGLADLTRDRVSRSGKVTLHNSSDRPTTLRLKIQTAGDDAGSARVTPPRVNLPAGGTRTVTVTVTGDASGDTNRDLAGWLVADPQRAGEHGLRVPYLLAVRPLVVQTSPDPSDGDSTAFVWSPTPLADAPTVTVKPPRGRPVSTVAEHDHGNWYRAPLKGADPGTHTVTVSAETKDGQRLRGGSAFEALPEDNRPGGRRWEPVGPNGSAGTIATTPADPSTAVLNQYVSRGPWKTDDAGATWRQLSRLPVADGTGTSLVDAEDPDTVWYAVNAQTGGQINTVLDHTYQGQLLRSRDGGDSWRRLDIPDTHIHALVSDPRSRVLAAVTADAVLLSHDGGDTWSQRPNPLGAEVLDAAVGGADLYLGGFTSVWKLPGVLTDGQAPEAQRVYDAPAGERLRGLAADQDLVATITQDERVLGSRNGGGDWSELYRLGSGQVQSITLRGDTLAVLTIGAEQHLSRDHGETWTVVNKPITGSVMSDVTPWGDGSLLWAAPGAGMFTTGRDGSDPTRTGIQGVNAYDLAVLNGGDQPELLAGTDSEIYRTPLPTGELAPGAPEWGLSGSEAYVGRRIGQITVSPKDPETVWKIRKDALSSFYVYRSDDSGQSWKERGRTNETPLGLAVGTDDDRVAVTFWSLAGPGVYRTLDGGESWKKLYHDRRFTAVATDPRDPDRLWLGAADGLYRSDDFGATVTRVADGAVNAITLSADGRRLVVGGSTLRVSDDGGARFRTADLGPLPIQVSEVVISPDDPNTLYAATSSFSANDLRKGGRGVLRSTNGGRSWVNVSGGLQNLDVLSLATSPDGDWLYAGTRMGGVHRLRVG